MGDPPERDEPDRAPDRRLERLIEAFDRAVLERDVPAAEALLDDEFALVLVHPAPAVVPRRHWLEVLPDHVVHEHAVRDRQVDVQGDCARYCGGYVNPIGRGRSERTITFGHDLAPQTA